jgi:hypothetical protein
MSSPTAVPIGWFAAEQAAQDLIAHAEGEMAVATFEYRGASDVLALTWFLADIEIPSTACPVASIQQLQAHLSIEQQWRVWCRTRLLRPPAAFTEADLRLARQAWSRLFRRGLLMGFTVSGVKTETVSSTGCCIGLHHARRILDAYCDRQL